MRKSRFAIRPKIVSVSEAGHVDGYREYDLRTKHASIVVRYYEAAASSAVIMVGGVSGDFDSPANGFYSRLAQALQAKRIGGLRVQFRDAVDLDESVLDVLIGIEFLRQRGVDRLGLVGHSFGGAVVIQTALRSMQVATVVTLSTQGFGTEGVEDLEPRSILLLHGYEDEALPPTCSIEVHERAGQPKALKLIRGARHGLDEAADEVFETVYDWLLRHLAPGGNPGPGKIQAPR